MERGSQQGTDQLPRSSHDGRSYSRQTGGDGGEWKKETLGLHVLMVDGADASPCLFPPTFWIS